MNFKPIETDENVLVMPGAVVCGDVTVGEGTAFWFNSVCRSPSRSASAATFRTAR